MKPLDELKKQGYRSTKPRQEVIKVLNARPLTVGEIYSTLQKKHIKIDLASVYRSLDLFLKMGVVNSIDLGEDKRRYELVQSQNHHHHLVCNHCGKIEDVKFDENLFDDKIIKKSHFKIDHHHLEFFGLCKNCQ